MGLTTRQDRGLTAGNHGLFRIIAIVTSGDRERERLAALGGLAALSLDALSSVAYGPVCGTGWKR